MTVWYHETCRVIPNSNLIPSEGMFYSHRTTTVTVVSFSCILYLKVLNLCRFKNVSLQWLHFRSSHVSYLRRRLRNGWWKMTSTMMFKYDNHLYPRVRRYFFALLGKQVSMPVVIVKVSYRLPPKKYIKKMKRLWSVWISNLISGWYCSKIRVNIVSLDDSPSTLKSNSQNYIK